MSNFFDYLERDFNKVMLCLKHQQIDRNMVYKKIDFIDDCINKLNNLKRTLENHKPTMNENYEDINWCEWKK